MYAKERVMTAIFRTAALILMGMGMSLSVPATFAQAEDKKDPIVYIVKKRDTLGKISRKYDVSVKSIAKLNSLDNPNKIAEGQVLLIPRDNSTLSAPKERVLTRPKRKRPEPKTVAMKRSESTDEVAKTIRPKKTITKRDYVEVRKEEPPTKSFGLMNDDVVAFEEEIVTEKEKQDKDYIGGSIAAWFVDIDAEVGADLGPIKGTKIDLQDALGADDDLTIPVVHVWAAPFGNPWIVLNWEFMEFDISGRRNIDESITFDGVTFSGTDLVEGSADVQRMSGWIEINPFQGDWGYIGGLIGGEYINIEAELTNDFNGNVSGTVPSVSTVPSSIAGISLPSSIVGQSLPTSVASVSGTTISESITNNVSVKEDAEAGTVSLGGQARFNINEDFFVSGRVRAFGYEASDIDFSFLDIQAEINYTAFDIFRFAGGYRALFIEAEKDDVSGELNMHGPFVQGGIIF